MKLLSALVYAIVLSIIYLIYTGVFNTVEVLIAVLVGVVVAYILADDIVKDVSKLSVVRFLKAVWYLLKYFTVIEAGAHWSVVKLIINPRARYSPAIVSVPYNLENEYSVVSVANSITNTPGTAVIDIDEKRKLYFVHWIDAPATDEETARNLISSKFEEYIKSIFER
ncbi:MAG: Na+/H+ antiporter subunit E [Desulfurococcaceae archaeon TW002]